ncbi:MAG: hypothetical protein IPH81_12815 [Candidatus Microthrix sp.]|nr:hypothetical protein [Candidatus Microthrix sp.]
MKGLVAEDRLPLHPGGKPGAAATAQPRGLDHSDHFDRVELGGGGQPGTSPGGDVVVPAGHRVGIEHPVDGRSTIV